MDKLWDVVIVTEKRYKEDHYEDEYSKTVVLEDQLVIDALKSLGLLACKKAWDDDSFDWQTTRFAVIRTTWDYFQRFDEFMSWLDSTAEQTDFINSLETLKWNINKVYLKELEMKGIAIPPSVFVYPKDGRKLSEIFTSLEWNDIVLKPAIGGGGWHTYLLNETNIGEYDSLFAELNKKETWLIQAYQPTIKTHGEISLMLFNGKYSHSILKKAKSGDFRVQDDFGGTVHPYIASDLEIAFAVNAVKACKSLPIYARVDIIWSKEKELYLSELELIEPELWLRENDEAAEKFAYALLNEIKAKIELSNNK